MSNSSSSSSSTPSSASATSSNGKSKELKSSAKADLASAWLDLKQAAARQQNNADFEQAFAFFEVRAAAREHAMSCLRCIRA